MIFCVFKTDMGAVELIYLKKTNYKKKTFNFILQEVKHISLKMYKC